MRLLLDTQVLIWWLARHRNLGTQAASIISDPSTEVWVSAASAWEIAIKSALGRLAIAGSPERWLVRELEGNRFRPLPVSIEHALSAGALPSHHRDPFDRMLIAQARCEGLRLVSADRIFSAYSADLIDARR